MSAIALLSENVRPSPEDIETAMSGNLCRCGTYPRIKAAIAEASSDLAKGCAMTDVDKTPPATGVDRRGFIFGSAAFVLAFSSGAGGAAAPQGSAGPQAAPIADVDGQRSTPS